MRNSLLVSLYTMAFFAIFNLFSLSATAQDGGCTQKFDCGTNITIDVSDLTALPECLELPDTTWRICAQSPFGTLPVVVKQYGITGGGVVVPTTVSLNVPCAAVSVDSCLRFRIKFQLFGASSDTICQVDSIVFSDIYCVCNDTIVPPPPPPPCDSCIGEKYECGKFIQMDVSDWLFLDECISYVHPDTAQAWSMSVFYAGGVITPLVTSSTIHPNGISIPKTIQFFIPCDSIPEGCCLPFSVQFQWKKIKAICRVEKTLTSPTYCVCNGFSRERVGERSLEKLEFKVYPNPASDELRVRTEGAVSHLRLVNAYGQLVLDRPNYESDQAISLVGLSKGMYYVLIKSNGIQSVQKVLLID